MSETGRISTLAGRKRTIAQQLFSVASTAAVFRELARISQEHCINLSTPKRTIQFEETIGPAHLQSVHQRRHERNFLGVSVQEGSFCSVLATNRVYTIVHCQKL